MRTWRVDTAADGPFGAWAEIIEAETAEEARREVESRGLPVVSVEEIEYRPRRRT